MKFRRITQLLVVASLLVTMNSWNVFANSSSDNIALNKPVTYSGVEGGKRGEAWTNPHLAGEFVVDGQSNTRWSADKVDSQWLTVDLGKVYDLQDIELIIHAESPDYSIDISNDNVNFTSVFATTGGSNGLAVTKKIDATGKSARYVKYQQNKMFRHAGNGHFYGSSLSEIIVSEFKSISTTEQGSIRLATFNIDSDGVPDITKAKALLAQNQIDYIGLQDVDAFTSINNFNMLESLRSGLFDHASYSKTLDILGGERGLGSLSKLPFDSVSSNPITTVPNAISRNYQRHVITKDSMKIAIYNVSLSIESIALRELQIKQLIDLIDNDTVEYKVILGNFNVISNKSEMDPFLKNYLLVNGTNGNWLNTFSGSANNKALANIVVSRNLEITDSYRVDASKVSEHDILVSTLKFNGDSIVTKQYYEKLLAKSMAVDRMNVVKSSYSSLQGAIQNAEGIFKSALTQSDINSAADTLLSALDGIDYINLALNRSVTYTGVEGGRNGDGWKHSHLVGELSVDGKFDTRWSADKQDVQALTVDLGKEYTVTNIYISFNQTSPSYDLLVSKDGINFVNVLENRANKQGGSSNVNIALTNQTARFVRYVQNKQFKHTNNQFYGSSIDELQVFSNKYIQSIQLSPSSDVISMDDSLNLEAIIAPVIANESDLEWESMNPAVAKVTNGVIQGVGSGYTKIIARSKGNPTVEETMEIKVVEGAIKVDSIQIPKSVSMYEKESRFIDYKLLPSKSIDLNQKVFWESKNPEIFTVSQEGLVKAVKPGFATLKISLVSNPSVFNEMDVIITNEPVNESYKIMSNRWMQRIVGDETLDLNDKDVSLYVRNLSNETQHLLATMNTQENRTELWDRIPSDTVAANFTTQFTKIKKLALAFGTVGSEYYQSKEVLNTITQSIEFMITTKKYNGTYSVGNWWDWQIGTPHQLIDTLFIIEPFLSNEKIKSFTDPLDGYAKRPSQQWPNYTATGANRTDIGLVVLASAILNRDDSRMDLVLHDVPQVFNIVDRGDGIYADGSLIQHGSIAYTGSYGNELVKGVGRIASITLGTKWEFEEDGLNNVVQLIDKGYIPLMFDGKMMGMVNGRSISRAPGTNPFTTEFEAGSETISNVMLVAQFAPESYRKKFESAIKLWLSVSSKEYGFYSKVRDVEALLVGKQIENSTSIKPMVVEDLVYVYGSMDRAVQTKQNYSFGVSMFSNRVSNYEYGNTENKKGWHTGSGVTYLYNKDYKQYEEGYWPTVDPYHLPGTTLDVESLAEGEATTKRMENSWVGGSYIDDIGSVGMDYTSKHFLNSMNTSAKKSWFMLDGVIVALGSEIRGESNVGIHTTIENRMLNEDGSNRVITSNQENVQNGMIKKSISKNGFVVLEGDSNANNISYLFPNQTEIMIGKETRSGKYEDINGYFINGETYTKHYLKMYLDHGLEASGDSYEYMIVPGLSLEETKAFSTKHRIQIIRNDKDVHAIEDSENGVFSMNVWDSQGTNLKGISVNKASSVTTVRSGNILKVSVSDPSHTLSNIDLNFDFTANLVDSNSKVVANGNDSYSLDVRGLKGSSLQLKFELVDKSLLESLIDEGKSFDIDMYTAQSFQDLANVLTQGAVVLDDQKALQSSIDTCVFEIQKAIDALKYNDGYQKLHDLRTVLIDEQNDVTHYWKNRIAEVIIRIDTAFKSDIGSLEFNTLLNDIETIISNWQYPLDFTLSNQLVHKFKNLPSSLYTASSYSPLKREVEVLIEIMSKYDETQILRLTQVQLDTLNEEIEYLINNLKVESILKTKALEVILEYAKNIKRDLYTQTSLDVLDTAIEIADSLFSNLPEIRRHLRSILVVDQNMIDSAFTTIESALAGLELKENSTSPNIPGIDGEDKPLGPDMKPQQPQTVLPNLGLHESYGLHIILMVCGLLIVTLGKIGRKREEK